METHDLEIYQGDDHAFEFTIETTNGTPVDLSNTTFKMAIKPLNGALITLPEQCLQISNTGRLVMILPHDLTATFTWRQARYDVQSENNGKIKTLWRGTLRVTEDITR